MAMDLVDLSYVENRGNQRYDEYKRNSWAKPPKDYDKWYGLIKALIEHLLARYGQKELETWYFEMWNEPDISYWRGTHEEFCKLYNCTEAAVHDACAALHFGGPASRGALVKAGEFWQRVTIFVDSSTKLNYPVYLRRIL